MTGRTSSSDERRGLVFALAGFALLSCGDAVVKSMAGDWPPTAIATLRYTIAAAGLSAMLLAREGRAGFRLPNGRLQLVRGLCVTVATISFFAALALMPLAEATTIVFAAPVVTALLAPVLLGEPARWRTWIASLAAFGGVMIVLRPNLATLRVAALLPLLSACAMSALFMANRAVAGSASPLAMQAILALVAVPMMTAVAVAGHLSGTPALHVSTPGVAVILKCAVVAVSASTAHWLIYLGTTRAGAATIAPMTYVQLLVAGTLGWLWFGDRPDAMTLVGAVIIIGAGLFLWHSARSERS